MSIRSSERAEAHNKILISISKRSKKCACLNELSEKQEDQIINFQKWHRESGLGYFDNKQAKAMRSLMTDIVKSERLSCFDHRDYLHLFEHIREKVAEGVSLTCPRCSS